jgi:hypothetical protein
MSGGCVGVVGGSEVEVVVVGGGGGMGLRLSSEGESCNKAATFIVGGERKREDTEDKATARRRLYTHIGPCRSHDRDRGTRVYSLHGYSLSSITHSISSLHRTHARTHTDSYADRTTTCFQSMCNTSVLFFVFTYKVIASQIP